MAGWFNFLGNSAADAFYAYLLLMLRAAFADFVDSLLMLNGYSQLSKIQSLVVGIGGISLVYDSTFSLVFM
jgi:hypothetical protein